MFQEQPQTLPVLFQFLTATFVSLIYDGTPFLKPIVESFLQPSHPMDILFIMQLTSLKAMTCTEDNTFGDKSQILAHSSGISCVTVISDLLQVPHNIRPAELALSLRDPVVARVLITRHNPRVILT